MNLTLAYFKLAGLAKDLISFGLVAEKARDWDCQIGRFVQNLEIYSWAGYQL